MSKVKRDVLGLYVMTGGTVSRPVTPTRFNVGEVVKTHRFQTGGVGLGKDHTCSHGTYLEIWAPQGMHSSAYPEYSEAQLREYYDWSLRQPYVQKLVASFGALS